MPNRIVTRISKIVNNQKPAKKKRPVKKKEGYAEFRRNVSRGLKLQLPATAKKEIKELEKTAVTIDRLRKKMGELDKRKAQITATIAVIEKTIDRNYTPVERVGPRGERFYYIRLMEEDSKYHAMILDRANLLLRRLTIDDEIDKISREIRNLVRKALTLQMRTEKKYNVVTSFMDRNLAKVANKYRAPNTAKKRRKKAVAKKPAKTKPKPKPKRKR